jgi:hypothetical protein
MIKKTLSLLTLFAACSLAQAQNENDDFEMPKALIKIYPQAFFINTFQLGIETFNSEYSRSFNFDAGLRTRNDNWDDSYSGGFGEIAYRKYFVPMQIRRKNYLGVYYSIAFKAGYYKTTTYDDFTGNYDEETELWSYSPSFIIGLQKTIWQVLLLDMFVGGAVGIPVYPDNAIKVEYADILDPAFKGIYPKIGVKIGIGL